VSARLLFVESLIALTGPPLHGKTTVARALAQQSNLQLVDLDAVRMRHFPDFADQPGQLDVTTRAYHFMMDDALALVAKGQPVKPVILAGTFSRREFQVPLLRALPSVRHRIFRLRIGSLDTIRTRLEQRRAEGTESAIRTEEQYTWSLGLVAPWPDGVDVVEIDAAGRVDAIVERVVRACPDLVSGPMPSA
jgi:predicted kinase